MFAFFIDSPLSFIGGAGVGAMRVLYSGVQKFSLKYAFNLSLTVV
jgi:hypothetical protein